MGSFSRWSYTSKCTVWEPTFDEFNQPSSWVRKVFSCSFRRGGSLPLNDRGEQFVPSTIVYLETNCPPEVGSKLTIGHSSSTTPPAIAETIRMVRSHDPTLFDEGTPDHEIITS
jgi:hypothetical protein